MSDLATTAGQKARTFTNSKGEIINLKAKPPKHGILPVSRTLIYQWIKLGIFPKGKKIGERITIWSEEDIKNWMENNAELIGRDK